MHGWNQMCKTKEVAHGLPYLLTFKYLRSHRWVNWLAAWELRDTLHHFFCCSFSWKNMCESKEDNIEVPWLMIAPCRSTKEWNTCMSSVVKFKREKTEKYISYSNTGTFAVVCEDWDPSPSLFWRIQPFTPCCFLGAKSWADGIVLKKSLGNSWLLRYGICFKNLFPLWFLLQ